MARSFRTIACAIGGLGVFAAAAIAGGTPGDVRLDSGQLIITGAAPRTEAVFSQSGGRFLLQEGKDSGPFSTSDPDCIDRGTSIECVSPFSVDVVASLGEDADEFSMNCEVVSASVSGNGGNDRLVGGRGSNFNGGAGNDHLETNCPADDTAVLNGNAGNDTLVPRAGTARGGEGTDQARFAIVGTTPVIVTLDNAANDTILGQPGDVGNDIERVTGTNGSDTITGSNVANRIDGRLRADRLEGGGGADRLEGGGGNDTLTGGSGADTLRGGDNNDTIRAREGRADASISCGAGKSDFADLDLRDPQLTAADGCERIERRAIREAAVVRIALVRRSGSRLRVTLSCPRSNDRACRGRLDAGRGSVRYRLSRGGRRVVRVRRTSGRRVRVRSVERGRFGAKTVIRYVTF